MSNDDLEQRIAAAARFAYSEELRFDAEATGAETQAGRLTATIMSAAHNAVRIVLEEIIEPGKYSEDDPPAF